MANFTEDTPITGLLSEAETSIGVDTWVWGPEPAGPSPEAVVPLTTVLDRRFLIPSLDEEPTRLLYATSGGEDDLRQERGPTPGVPVRQDQNAGALDLKLVKRPDVPVIKHVEGDVVVHVSGDIGKARVLWRRKGDPFYRGKSDGCDLARSIVARTSGTVFMEHPKLLAMSNGELLLVWAEHPTSDVTDTGWLWKARVFDPRTYQWGTIITLPTVGTATGYSVERVGPPIDNPSIAVAESDTNPGHVVAVGIADSANAASPTAFDFVTFTSLDFGRTWRTQNVAPDEISGSGIFSHDILFVGGRIVLALLQSNATNVEFFFSNDQGATWIAGTAAIPAVEGGLSLVRTVNGSIIVFAGSATGAARVGFSGDGGVTFQAFTDSGLDLPNTTADAQGDWMAADVDDEGYVYFYMWATGNSRDALLFVRAGERAITLTDAEKATNIFDDGSQQKVEQMAWDDVQATRDPGVRAIDVATWRGRHALVTYYQAATQRTLAIHFAAEWNDLRYLAFPPDVDALAAWYFWYLPNDHPDLNGANGYAWALTGTKTNNLLLENGGYLIDDDGVSADFFTRGIIGVPAVTRTVCRVLDGGATASQVVYYAVRAAGPDWRFRAHLSTTGFRYFDETTAAALHAEVLTDLTEWHEFVTVVLNDDLVQIYWRKLDPEDDGEHAIYSEVLGAPVALDVGTPHVLNELEFGHVATADSVSEWRQLAQLLQNSATDASAVRYDPEDTFQLWDNTNNVHSSSDLGAEPSDRAMDIADGLAMAFTGAGALAGDGWDIETRADYPKEKILEGGPSTPWASEKETLDAGEEINVVFDAGEDHKFRIGAIALFGLNFPLFKIEMNDADDWAAPPVSLSSVMSAAASSGTTFRRGEKLRTPTGLAVTLDLVSNDGNALILSTTSPVNTAPFRPHQFKPRGTRRWYLARADGTETYVWEILDNNVKCLFLSEAPTDVQLTGSPTFIIFSDRIMVDLTNDADVDECVGYRFLRISIGDATNATRLQLEAAANFFKIGRVVLGTAPELSNVDWGFQVDMVPNVELVSSRSRQVRANKVGEALERWRLTWPTLPGEVRDDLNYIKDVDTWERVRDIVIATGFGERSSVLVHSMYGIDQDEWLRVTGDRMTLGRIAGVLSAAHASYVAVEDCSGNADLGWIMSLAGMDFLEEA